MMGDLWRLGHPKSADCPVACWPPPGQPQVAWKSVLGPQLDELLIAFNRRPRGLVVAKFNSLPEERLFVLPEERLFVKLFSALVFVPRRHFCCRLGKALGRTGVAQPSQGHIASLRGGLRGVQRAPLGMDAAE